MLTRGLTILLLLVWPVLLPAQATGVADYYQDRIARSDFTEIDIAGQSEMQTYIRDYYLRTLPGLQGSSTSLKLLHEAESQTGWHFLFQQQYQGLPVFDAELKVNTYGKQRISSSFDLTFAMQQWASLNLKEEAQELDHDKALASFYAVEGELSDPEKVIFYHPVDEVPVVAFHFFLRTAGDYLEYVVDANGDVLLERSRKSNFLPDSLITVNLFLPDPVTAAESEYGGQLQDFNDQDSPAINQYLTEMQVKAKYENGNFLLEQPYILMRYFEGDSMASPVGSDPDFRYTRGEGPFEFTHAYSHIVLFNEYIRSLGFPGATSWQLNVDARGKDEDNSYFTNTAPPQIVLGLGNVDDAEDGHVVIHEYGHALMHWGSPNSNVGTQRQAMEEGTCDYFAVSYARQYSDYEWWKVFKWDGHNPYWSGRIANSEKQYPADYNDNNIYGSGEIWSAVLMEIYEEIGGEQADRLVTEFLFTLSKNLSMRDAAALLLNASGSLYGKAAENVIFDRLLARGLIRDYDTEVVGSQEFFKYEGSLAIYIDEVAPNATISVYDAQGRLLRQEKQINRSFLQIPAHWFPASGVYFIHLKTNQSDIVEKFVKVNK